MGLVATAGFTDGVDTLGQVIDRFGVAGTFGLATGNDKFSGIELTPRAEAEFYNFSDISNEGTDIGDNVTAAIGFWKSHWGRNLIHSLNGSRNSTALGDWMATSPNLYEAGAVYDARRGQDMNAERTKKWQRCSSTCANAMARLRSWRF